MHKVQATPVEVLEDMVSDRGSTPLASTNVKMRYLNYEVPHFCALSRVGFGPERASRVRKPLRMVFGKLRYFVFLQIKLGKCIDKKTCQILLPESLESFVIFS